MQPIATKSGAANPKLGFQPYEEAIADVVAQIDLAIEKVNAAIEGLDELGLPQGTRAAFLASNAARVFGL